MSYPIILFDKNKLTSCEQYISITLHPLTRYFKLNKIFSQRRNILHVLASLSIREHYSRKGCEGKMIPKVKRALITRPDGSISPYRNSELIPLFYVFPKNMLKAAGEIFLEVPRKPVYLFGDRKWINFIESDVFLEFIIDATAFIVRQFMGKDAAREFYSGYEPSWILAHATQYWLEGLTEEKILPTINELAELCKETPSLECSYSSEEDIEIYFQYAVRHVMAKYNMYEILDVAEEFRCHEDFAKCNSNKKTDFHRKWYHTRSTYSTISLEAEMKKYSENSDWQELPLWDMNSTTEEEIISEVMVKQFTDSLSEKDRKILQMRLEGYTQKEIAEELGYNNHSGVQKRITKIGLAYQEFTKDDLGFDEEN